MAVLVRIPTPLRKFTENQSEVHAEGATVQQVLDDLELSFHGIRERLCDEQGGIRKFINLYLNDQDIRFMDGENTSLKDGDELAIIPAIAGGRVCVPNPSEKGHRLLRPKGIAERSCFPTQGQEESMP